MRSVHLSTLLVLGAVGLFGPMATPTQAQEWLAFRGTLGHESLSGDVAKQLSGDTRSEWTVFFLRLPLRVRLGAGLSRVTYDLNADVSVPDSIGSIAERWHHFGWHVTVGLEVISTPWIDAYVERRRIWGRFRSQRHTLWRITDDPPKQTPYPEWSGSGWETVVGVRSDLGCLPFQLDVLLRGGDFAPRDVDLTALYGLNPFSGGSAFGVQIGAFWHP